MLFDKDYTDINKMEKTKMSSAIISGNDDGPNKLFTEYVDNVNHPKHYGKVPGIECIDVVRHFNFNRGNAIKYLWRAGEKDPKKIVEDLSKAIWYIED